MNGPGKLLKYSASAGSGKTHALAAFYLSRVLYDPEAFRRILAVTFTNSAAAEMKSRILKRLSILGMENSNGDKERREFADYLCSFFPELWPDREAAIVTVRRNAPLALNNILQDYSRFTVGTIDSFFQRVIRAFAREMDIPAGYEIELEHEAVLSDAVDSLLADVASDRKLLEWISSYVASRLDDSKGWDIRKEIMEVAAQIFREDFRQLSADDRRKIGDYGVMAEYASRVFSIRNGFESELKNLAMKGVSIYAGCGLTPDDFLSKSRGGVGESLRRYTQGDIRKPNNAWIKAAEEGKYYAAGAGPAVVKAFGEAMERGLDDVVNAISELFEKRYGLYVSASVQVRTIHVIGILGALSERVREQAHDQNLFLLSDSGELISRLIADDDTPFIYEKIGSAYDHYIIDEFQDTSRIQWNNFRPLISETLSRGRDNLVVGDVKQSIYRWRNSDWRIIHTEAAEAFGEETLRTIQLSTNFRSRINIIRFNNSLFAPGSIPSLCDEKLAFDRLRISDVYSGSEQQGTPGKEGGYVKLTLYGKSEDEGWKERVLNDLPAVIEKIQDHRYTADDILFLCRTNEEGKSIISRILEYSASCPSEQRLRYNYEITSGESLLLERNPAVTFMIACLRHLTDPDSRINMSQMVRSFVLATGRDESLVYGGDAAESTGEPLPDGWRQTLGSFRNTSLYSATESMIRFFGLGELSSNIAYISSFQDVVLAWSGRHSSDISAFVKWWDEEGYKSTLSQSDRQEAMRVMTIHKAKGLQSRVVIVPFASWDFSKPGFSRPLLWVTDVPAPFAPMPVVLPEISSRLEESLFSEAARMEKASDWLDGVNLLYVAFTRAVDALLVMAPEIAKPSSGSAGTASLINEALGRLPDDFETHDEEGIRYIECGQLPPVEKQEREPQPEISRYAFSEPRGSLRLRTGDALPQDAVKLTEPGGRAYGIMMHEILSRVTTTGDIRPVVDQACAGGLLPISDRDTVVSRLTEMLTSDRVRHWFDGSSRVMTEATILLPTGAARRPDRVMMDDDTVTVVDYKFGEPSPRHIHQAAEYRELLTAMGYRNVKSWLWYVEKDIIEEA
ncbi:MAG: UvrD-helicase domain-containing protein [Bacteroidales bacterium]|nr:UvrD-helicase domain-containing protein [Bacteroidales bacterium]